MAVCLSPCVRLCSPRSPRSPHVHEVFEKKPLYAMSKCEMSAPQEA